jgi:hypothetical protein
MVAPALIITETDLEEMFAELDKALDFADAQLG